MGNWAKSGEREGGMGGKWGEMGGMGKNMGKDSEAFTPCNFPTPKTTPI